jgi:hypothetical protein
VGFAVGFVLMMMVLVVVLGEFALRVFQRRIALQPAASSSPNGLPRRVKKSKARISHDIRTAISIILLNLFGSRSEV